MTSAVRQRRSTDELEWKAPQRWPQNRLDWRLQDVAKAVGGGYYQLQMPLKLLVTNAIEAGTSFREPVAGQRLGPLEGAGAGSLLMHSWRGPKPYHHAVVLIGCWGLDKGGGGGAAERHKTREWGEWGEIHCTQGYICAP